MATYKVLSLDVWAGEEEGLWEINNWFNCGSVDIEEDASNEDVLDILHKEGYISRVDIAEVQNWGDDFFYQIVDISNNDYPVYQLQLEE